MDRASRLCSGRIPKMAQVSRDSMNGAQTLSEIIGQNAGFSRELRKPLKKIEGALRNMVDAQSILDGWTDDIDGLLDGASAGKRSHL